MTIKKTKLRSKHKRKIPNRKLRYLILSIVIFLLYIFIQGDQGLLKYIKLQQEKKLLLKQIEELKKEHNDLINEIDLLTNNYRYIEKNVRERLQMGKKGEKIYILTPPKE